MHPPTKRILQRTTNVEFVDESDLRYSMEPKSPQQCGRQGMLEGATTMLAPDGSMVFHKAGVQFRLLSA
jgi:hypothetical protein